MARPKREQSDPRVINDWINDGRGAGRNGAYQTWLRVQDVPSRGIRQRLAPVNSITGDRMLHVLSGPETQVLNILLWGPDVVDIREQYPLLPLELTQKIAKELGVEHHTDRKTGRPVVPTTDFLVTRNINGVEKHHGIDVKLTKELGSLRVQQKLQLARTWHEQMGYGWSLLTERDIPRFLAANLEFLCGRTEHLHRWGALTDEELARIERALLPAIWSGEETLAKAALACDVKLGLEDGTSLLVTYKFIYTRRWKIDLRLLQNACLDPGRPLILLKSQPDGDYGTE